MTAAEWNELCGRAPVLLDGAWGTQLHTRGLATGEISERWNITHPAEVQALAGAYVEAGSGVVLTNTFGANRIVLARHGLDDKTAEINREAARLSRSAADSRARVFGSIGPSGKMLLMGEVSEDELTGAFEEQARALADGGVDALVIETMADLDEAVCAVRAACGTGLPVVACMVYDSGPNNDRTMMGISPAEAAERLQEAGAWALGANCGQGPAGFRAILDQYAAVSRLPLWMKPNAGLPEVVDGNTVYRVTPEEFAREAAQLCGAGATFVGGCCGTGPAFIEALRGQVH